MKKLCIIGSGGFAKEVYSYLPYTVSLYESTFDSVECFIDCEEKPDVMGIKVMPMCYFNPSIHIACIAVGSPLIKKKIVEELPTDTEYATIIHRTAIVGPNVSFGRGSIICPNCTITVDVRIGDFCTLNLNTTIGHDSVIGNYFTSSPGVHISGSCFIGDQVYFGTNSTVNEKKIITDNVTIGSNACVVKSINETGTYVGIPARKNER